MRNSTLCQPRNHLKTESIAKFSPSKRGDRFSDAWVVIAAPVVEISESKPSGEEGLHSAPVFSPVPLGSFVRQAL